MLIIPKFRSKTDFTLSLQDYPELNMNLPWPAQGEIILHVLFGWRYISIGAVFGRFIQCIMVEDIAIPVLKLPGKCVPIYTAS